MSIRIEELSHGELDEWDTYVDASPQTNVFHQSEALRLLADDSNTELRPLVGFKGEHPVGLLPLFEFSEGPLHAVFSPPPYLEIKIGPAMVVQESMKQRTREKQVQRFLDGCFDWIASELDPGYVDIKTTDRFRDVRPFTRRGFDVSPAYTYVLDLTPGRDEILMGFTKEKRRTVRNTPEEDYAIEEGGRDAIERIVEQMRSRLEELGKYFWLDPELVVALYDNLPDGHVRPYVCRVDGSFDSGLITVEFGDTIHWWQGGVKPTSDVPSNALLHWHVINEGIERDMDRYEIPGADEERLSNYKSKFGPEPRPIFLCTQKTAPTWAMWEVYRRVPHVWKKRLGVNISQAAQFSAGE